MGSAETYFFECGRCLATYTGRPSEIARLGWVRHQFTARIAPRRGEFLLCTECEAHMKPIWKDRKAA